MANTPIVNAGEKYINNLEATYLTSQTIQIEVGQARDEDNINDITLDAPVIVDARNNGVNGLDTGSLVAGVWYAIYIIGDSTGFQPTAGIFSANTSEPLLPGDYDMFRKIGWVITNGTPDFERFFQYGSGVFREYYFDFEKVELSAGVATAFTNVDLLSSVPPEAVAVWMNYLFSSSGGGNIAFLRPLGALDPNGTIRFGTGSLSEGQVKIPTVLSGGQPVFQYKVSTGADPLTLATYGFDFYL
jgi:hypothetical protein